MEIKDKLFILLILIMMHLLLLSYFNEYLLAHHPFYKFDKRKGKISGFGRSKTFYHAKESTLEFYTEVSYYEQGQEHISKIVRGIDDEIGKEIVIAVDKEGKLAVRYEKFNWYDERSLKGGIASMRGCIGLYIFTHIIMTCNFITSIEATKQIYIIYILFAILYYLFLPQVVGTRNFIWEKDYENLSYKMERERMEKTQGGEESFMDEMKK